MTRKTFQLVAALVGAAETAAVAIVTFCDVQNAAAINAAIVIAGTAVIDICAQFVKD